MNQLADRRLEEKERRRAEILDAAEAVATEVGIGDMTMDLVARRARLSRALIYVYFQDKLDLTVGICERALVLLHQRFQAAAARHARGLDQVLACGRAYVAFAQEFPIYFEILSRLQAHAPDPQEPNRNELACQHCGEQVHAVIVSALEAGIRDGSVRRDLDYPLLVAMTLWAFMHGTVQVISTKAEVLAKDGISVKQLVDNALALCTRSLAANT